MKIQHTRSRKNGQRVTAMLTPLEAIQESCLACCCGDRKKLLKNRFEVFKHLKAQGLKVSKDEIYQAVERVSRNATLTAPFRIRRYRPM